MLECIYECMHIYSVQALLMGIPGRKYFTHCLIILNRSQIYICIYSFSQIAWCIFFLPKAKTSFMWLQLEVKWSKGGIRVNIVSILAAVWSELAFDSMLLLFDDIVTSYHYVTQVLYKMCWNHMLHFDLYDTRHIHIYIHICLFVLNRRQEFSSCNTLFFYQIQIGVLAGGGRKILLPKVIALNLFSWYWNLLQRLLKSIVTIYIRLNHKDND